VPNPINSTKVGLAAVARQREELYKRHDNCRELLSQLGGLGLDSNQCRAPEVKGTIPPGKEILQDRIDDPSQAFVLEIFMDFIRFKHP
jgi:hypothetical protein